MLFVGRTDCSGLKSHVFLGSHSGAALCHKKQILFPVLLLCITSNDNIISRALCRCIAEPWTTTRRCRTLGSICNMAAIPLSLGTSTHQHPLVPDEGCVHAFIILHVDTGNGTTSTYGSSRWWFCHFEFKTRGLRTFTIAINDCI